jgi:hypothetical protein
MIFFIISICSFIFAFHSQDLLRELTGPNNWKKINIENDGKIIYQSESNKKKYIKIEKKFISNPTNALNIVQSIEDYNEIISNDNIDTHLIKRDNDTLYVSQIIKTSIPFLSNRQYIFKMYKVGESKVDWYILNENDFLDMEYISENAHILTYGAGSWEVNNNTVIYKIYVDDEVVLPSYIIGSARRKSIVSIFEDVISNLE